MDGRLILVVLVACFVFEITGNCVDRKQQGGGLITGLWNLSVVALLACRIYKPKKDTNVYKKKLHKRFRDLAPPSFISY